MNLLQVLNEVDRLMEEVRELRPINPDQERRIMQKFRLDWTYHSNAIEGNSLTFGETRAFLLHGITAQGKPFRDYLEIRGHHAAIDFVLDLVRQKRPLTEAAIRELHETIMVEPRYVDAQTPDGRPTRRLIGIGEYKTAPNHVRTSTGEIHYYASPEETPARMGDLMQWYQAQNDLHPLILAATFHYQFVSIHPFDDGNGRMARLLMNLILMQHEFVPVVVSLESKEDYLLALEVGDAGDLEPFNVFIGEQLIHSLKLFLRGARGESIEELDDLDKKIFLLEKRLSNEAKQTAKVAFSEHVRTQLETDFFKPLFPLLKTMGKSFETLFKDVSMTIISPKIIDLLELEQIPEGFMQTMGERLQIHFNFFAFKHNNQDMGYHLDFDFQKYRFKLAFITRQGNSGSHEIFDLGYDQIYTQELVEQIINTIGNIIYGNLEEMVNINTG